MKDRRNYLKIACLIEAIYIVVMTIYYVFFMKYSDQVIASLFLLGISLFLNILLYKESKKEIKELSNTKVLFISIWFFLEPIVPGILGFLFLNSLKEKKKVQLPVIKKDNRSLKGSLKTVFLLSFFIIIMFITPHFKLFSNINTYIIYLIIILLILLFYSKELIENFKVFIKNFKIYFPFIIKRYFIMLGVMLVVAVPIVLINNGNTSTNQQMLNSMFKELPLKTFLLSTIYAPFAEESIFRMSLSKLFNNRILFIIVSGFIFGGLHVIDKFTSFADLLYIFQYSALGVCLAKAYDDTNNIFVPISMHFIQNLLAAVLVLLLY